MPPLVLFCGFRDTEDIGSFFRDQALEKGYRLFKNNHVYAVREEDGVDIAAKCHSQQGKHVYDVTIRLNPQSRKIIAGSCTCRYGVLSECKHSAAVVHYVNKHAVATCTSLPQAWGKPSKKPKLDDKASIADLFGGLRTEPKARRLFEGKVRGHVTEVGLLVHNGKPWLCGSADGLFGLTTGTVLLEIKCPSSVRNSLIVDITRKWVASTRKKKTEDRTSTVSLGEHARLVEKLRSAKQRVLNLEQEPQIERTLSRSSCWHY
ncbi:uncharacterized protein ISCGN_021652 [Ixodes scapularis]